MRSQIESNDFSKNFENFQKTFLKEKVDEIYVFSKTSHYCFGRRRVNINFALQS